MSTTSRLPVTPRLNAERALNIWALNWSEVVPMQGGSQRAQRVAMLCRFISAAGHSITWWTSTFDHTRKKQRCGSDACIQMDERFSIRLVHAPGYPNNTSLARVYDHLTGAKRFLAAASTLPRPDLLFVSLPTNEFAAAGCRYASRRGIPVILDIRDLWPDVFFELLPAKLRRAGKLAFAPYEALARYSCRTASGITGPNEDYVNWGVAKAGRARNPRDRVFPLAYTSTPPPPAALSAAREFWTAKGVRLDGSGFNTCFIGTLGRQFDIETVISAAASLQQSHPLIRFIMCGTGDQAERYRSLAAGLPNMLWPGWVGAAEIWVLMRASRVGLAPYLPNRNFEQHIPNKPIEYLSAGLPVLTTLDGALGRLLEKNGCGLTYCRGDSESLARQIAELHDEPAQLGRFSENAGRTFGRFFVAEEVYPRMVEYLEQIAAGDAIHEPAESFSF